MGSNPIRGALFFLINKRSDKMTPKILIYNGKKYARALLKEYDVARHNGINPRNVRDFFSEAGLEYGLDFLEMKDFKIFRTDVSGLEIKCESKDTTQISETGWRTLYKACKDSLDEAIRYSKAHNFIEIDGRLIHKTDYEGRPTGKIFKMNVRYMDFPNK